MEGISVQKRTVFAYTFESCVSAIRRQIRCRPSGKWHLPRAVPHWKIKVYHIGWFHCLVFLQNLPGEHEGWRFERAMAWFCHQKQLISWISATKTLVFSLQVGISGPPMRSSYTTVVALGCSESRVPSTSGNWSGFCNLSDSNFSLHLGKGCGCGQNDIIILMASKFLLSVRFIVWIQCDLHCLTVLRKVVIP